jgi:exosortase C (VPDSG-CTERM-specific)
MNDSKDTTLPHARPGIIPETANPPAGRRGFWVAAFVLLAAFSVVLRDLVRFALQSDLYSHVALVPFVSIYLAWLKRDTLATRSPPDSLWAALLLGSGLLLLTGRLVLTLGTEDALAMAIYSLVLLFAGLCALLLGRHTFRALAFPLGFLLFMAPLPTAIMEWIEVALQHRSADAAHILFSIAGTPFFRAENFFQLPGMKIFVAPECSGIHSTLALFITSTLAGYFFLRSPRYRLLLTLAVIPLAIARNGLRIFVIAELCVHIGPEMIDSAIHRHGGPFFFALSMVPFVIGLWVLMRRERRRNAPA